MAALLLLMACVLCAQTRSVACALRCDGVATPHASPQLPAAMTAMACCEHRAPAAPACPTPQHRLGVDAATDFIGVVTSVRLPAVVNMCAWGAAFDFERPRLKTTRVVDALRSPPPIIAVPGEQSVAFRV